MTYTVDVSIDAYHVPTEQWHVHRYTHDVRAVSRGHAFKKALARAIRFPCYADRVHHPDWRVTAEARLTAITLHATTI